MMRTGYFHQRITHFICVRTRQQRTNISSQQQKQNTFFLHQYFPSSIFNELWRSHNFAFRAFLFTLTWWFLIILKEENKIIGFFFGLLRRRISFFIHFFFRLLKWVFNNNMHLCMFVCFFFCGINSSITHVNDSKI